MTIVEHNLNRTYPLLTWGTKIDIAFDGNKLQIRGVVPILEDEQNSALDCLYVYRQAYRRFGEKRHGKNSPHIDFANADDDRKLIKFVKRFGPICVTSLRMEEPTSQDDQRGGAQALIAEQDLPELRREQQIYRAAVQLVSELQRGREVMPEAIRVLISTIVDEADLWPNQWWRERKIRIAEASLGAEPHWHFSENNRQNLLKYRYWADRDISTPFGPDPIRAGHLVVCELINAFPPLVYSWGNTPVEAPQPDLRFGVRPLLYYMVRREYLQGGGIGICGNNTCRQLFEIERSGQVFCGDDCSRHQRQREYWKVRGRKLRKEKRKKRQQTRKEEAQ